MSGRQYPCLSPAGAAFAEETSGKEVSSARTELTTRAKRIRLALTWVKASRFETMPFGPYFPYPIVVMVEKLRLNT
jgi:hypothetical protein